LIADDNADMRDYRRILGLPHADVGDGAPPSSDLAATFPDLVLADVMMPSDGFGLLAVIRADERLVTPTILLGPCRRRGTHRGFSAGAAEYP
jgi:CheY-like chemotaxis protein